MSLSWDGAPKIEKDDAKILLTAYRRVFDPACDEKVNTEDKLLVLADLARHCNYDVPFEVMLEYSPEQQLSVQEGRRTVFLRIKQFTEFGRMKTAPTTNEPFEAKTED